MRLEALTQSKSASPESNRVMMGNDWRAAERSTPPRAPRLALENYFSNSGLEIYRQCVACVGMCAQRTGLADSQQCLPWGVYVCEVKQ